MWLERGSKIITLKVICSSLMKYAFHSRSSCHSGESGVSELCGWNILHESLVCGLYWLLYSDPKPARFLPLVVLSKQKSSLHKFWSLSTATQIMRVNSYSYLLQNIKKPCILLAFLLMSQWLCFGLGTDYFSKVIIIYFFSLLLVFWKQVNYVVPKLGEW